MLWPCPQILKPDWKGFPRANPLAYLASSSAMKEKSFIAMTPGDRVWVDVEVSELGLLVLGQLVGVGLVDAQLLQTPDLIRRRENSLISAGARAGWI